VKNKICVPKYKCLTSKKEFFFFFFDSRKPHPPESALCGLRWGSKTSAVPGSYKRCTPWLELETCCADPKFFVITLRFLGTKKKKKNSLTSNSIHNTYLITKKGLNSTRKKTISHSNVQDFVTARDSQSTNWTLFNSIKG
jgi:hypothetical protein